jgi:ribose/xylose/arabinose/galactoside ABC-type transport system permease subunit
MTFTAAARRIRSSETAPRFLLAAIVLLSVSLWNYNFLTESNMFTVMEGFAFVGLVALGVGITIIAGEFDLSVASLAAVSGILALQIHGPPLIVSVILVALIAGTFGAVQGFLIHKLGISSLVFTIATLIGLRGVAFILSAEKTVVASDVTQADALRQQYFIFSPFSLFTIAMFVLAGVFLSRTRIGREIYAIGGGRAEAAGAGIRATRPLVVAFAISGALAGVAGALSAIKSGSAQPTGFEELLLPAVTAALIGGVSLFGGVGTVLGIALGAFTLRCVISVLYLEGSQFYVENFVTGLLLLVVLAIEMTTRNWEQLKLLLRGRRRPTAPGGPTTGGIAS